MANGSNNVEEPPPVNGIKLLWHPYSNGMVFHAKGEHVLRERKIWGGNTLPCICYDAVKGWQVILLKLTANVSKNPISGGGDAIFIAGCHYTRIALHSYSRESYMRVSQNDVALQCSGMISSRARVQKD